MLYRSTDGLALALCVVLMSIFSFNCSEDVFLTSMTIPITFLCCTSIKIRKKRHKTHTKKKKYGKRKKWVWQGKPSHAIHHSKQDSSFYHQSHYFIPILHTGQNSSTNWHNFSSESSTKAVSSTNSSWLIFHSLSSEFAELRPLPNILPLTSLTTLFI